MTSNIVVSSSSLEKAATMLNDAAADLRTAEFDILLLDAIEVPRCDGAVVTAVREFAGFATERYRYTIALIAVLSAGVKTVAASYRQVDETIAQRLPLTIEGTAYQPGAS